jgi:hypothetical protein
MDSSVSEEYQVTDTCEHENETPSSINGGESLDWVNNTQFLHPPPQKDSAQWK